MSSKRHLRRRACGRKTQYRTQAEAVAAIISMKKKGCFGLQSYKCKFGDHWHVGHRTWRTAMAMRQRGTTE